MAKHGIECEGRLRGVPTLFIDAKELSGTTFQNFTNLGLSHVYVSDRDNTLSYMAIGNQFKGALVTLDVTKVKDEPRPTNVTVILTMPHEFWESVSRLRPDDQVKFHSEDRHVLCAPVRSFAPTYPIEFAGDVELKR